MIEATESSFEMITPAFRTTLVNEYYFSVKLHQISKMRSEGKKVINMGIGSPDLPPSPNVIEKLHSSATKPDHHGYQSYRGSNELRQSFADWYNRYFKVNLNFENEILPLMGSKEGIMHISMAFLNPGDRVLIPDPGYPTYAAVANLIGAETVFYDLKKETDWLPDLDSIEKTDLSKVKMMWVNYPHMPSGAIAGKGFYKKLIAFGKRNNILICNDNPYSFVLNEHPESILSVEGSMDIAIELNSLSKSHRMAGWRMGMVVSNRVFIEYILKVKSNMDSGMFRPIQDAAVEAMALGTDWYKSMNEIYEKRRIFVWKIYDLLGCTYNKSQTGLFVWARIPDVYSDAETLSERLLNEAYLFVTPGHIFGKNGKNYLRISLCTPESLLGEAIQRIIKLNKTR